MLPVDVKKWQSILRNANVPCRYFLNVPVDLKKSPMASKGSRTPVLGTSSSLAEMKGYMGRGGVGVWEEG